MQVFLSVTIGENGAVTPEVGVSSAGFNNLAAGASPMAPDLDTVRRGVGITNQVLGFAEGLRKESS